MFSKLYFPLLKQAIAMLNSFNSEEAVLIEGISARNHVLKGDWN